jgi:hypothetical protein
VIPRFLPFRKWREVARCPRYGECILVLEQCVWTGAKRAWNYHSDFRVRYEPVWAEEELRRQGVLK